MAHSFTEKRVHGRIVGTVTLLDGVIASAGEWVDVDGFCPASVHFEGIAGGATAKLWVSNNPSRPSDSINDVQVGSTLSAEGILTLDYPVKWIKAQALESSPGVGDDRAIRAYYKGVIP